MSATVEVTHKETCGSEAVVDSTQGPVASVRLFTVEEYFKLFELGILKAHEKTELIHGQVLKMLPQGIPHSQVVIKFVERFYDSIPKDEWCVYAQNTIELNGHLPEPDLCVVNGPSTRYDHQRPTTENIAYLIEVADSSLEYDRGEKLSLYAEAGIKRYWIINLVDEQIEIHSEPMAATETSPATYRTRTIVRKEETAWLEFSGERVLSFRLVDFLPGALPGSET